MSSFFQLRKTLPIVANRSVHPIYCIPAVGQVVGDTVQGELDKISAESSQGKTDMLMAA